MGFRIFLVNEVSIIAAYHFHIIFLSQFQQYFIGFLLQRECFTVGTDMRIFDLMSLDFQIIVIAKYAFVPLYSFMGTVNITFQYLCRNFTGNTGRTDNQVLMVLFQFGPVSTWAHIITVHPCMTH